MYIFYVGYNGKIVISTTNKVVLSICGTCPDVKWFVLLTNKQNEQFLIWNLSYYNKLLGVIFQGFDLGMIFVTLYTQIIFTNVLIKTFKNTYE
jgi:hypothetical protein